MNNENWYSADNAAKMFLATYSERDTRSIRVSCTLFEQVEPAVLEEALKRTIATRSLFQVRIRRGVFWHYIEHTNALPTVTEEHERPCPVLYGRNYDGVLHYSVTYYRNRINLEVFHALTDGTGAMEFLNVLVLNYLKIKHPEELSEVFVGTGASAGELEQDSFSKFYDREGKDTPVPAAKKAYHIRGLKLPYKQLQFIKVTMPADKVIAGAKQNGASVTSYLGARLMLAIYRDMPALKRRLPVTISIPVNLRNFYSSDTSRNFFNSISISHEFSGGETLASLAKEFDEKLKESLKPEIIHNRMVHFLRLQRMPFLRAVPLVLKLPVIRAFSKKSARSVSAVISNLGIIRVPEELHKYVKGYEMFCSHSELYLSVCTFGSDLVLGITSGCRNTGVLKAFISGLAKDGIDVLLESTEVIR